MTENEERLCFKPLEDLRISGGGDKPFTVDGLAVPYDQPSDDLGGYREVIKRGAFAESLRSDRDMRADVEHDEKQLLGRRAKGTLVFSEDARGLRASITIPDTQVGRNAVEEIRCGNRDAMSISMRRRGMEVKFVQRGGETIREVSRAVLTGVTLTAFPAYPQTVDTLVMRSLEQWREDRRTEEEKAADDAREAENRDGRARLDLAEAEIEPEGPR